MNRNCSIWSCLNGKIELPDGINCEDWYNQCIQKRNMEKTEMTPKQKYKACIKKCWYSGFSSAYTGNNRMDRDNRCFDRCAQV